MQTSETYIVPECNLPELEARIAKLNKRAARLGVEAITLVKEPDHKRYQVEQLQSGCEIGGPMARKVWHKLHPSCKTIQEEKARCKQAAASTGAYLAAAWEPTGEVMTWWKVVVTGTTPTFQGWEFVATLEPMQLEDTKETLNLVQTVPGKDCPTKYRNLVGHCDHCKAKRRRNQTFVLHHEDGAYKCVGRQCIKDFLGYNGDPHGLAAAAELLAELGGLCEQAEDDDGFGYGGGGWRENSWDLPFFLQLTAARIDRRGWMSRSAARELERAIATADVVLDILTPPKPNEPEAVKKAWQALVNDTTVTDDHEAQAEAATEWCKAIDPKLLEENNYLANINLVARCGTVTRKTAGLAASIIPAHRRHLEQEVKREELAKRPPSVHVGVVGKRQEFTVTCQRVFSTESQYGTTGIHKMVDQVGNDLTWFASGKGEWLKEGQSYQVKATVKAHGDYKGRPQTVVSRLAIVKELPEKIPATA